LLKAARTQLSALNEKPSMCSTVSFAKTVTVQLF
jgi:hypothetical protein